MNQLTISCENRLRDPSGHHQILSQAKENIVAFNAGSAGAMGYVQLIVTNPGKAKRVLEARSIPYYEERVFPVKLPNVLGAPSRFVSKLAAKGINIGAAYQTATEGASKARVVLAVSNLGTADRVR